MYYQEISILESGSNHAQHAIDQIFQAVHSHNSKIYSKIAIDFPDYGSDNYGFSIFGNKIRIFSDEYLNLHDFSSQTPIIRMLSKAKVIFVNDISELPSKIDYGVIIKRDCRSNKTQGGIDRDIRRYARTNPDVDVESRRKILQKRWLKNSKDLKGLPYISLRSSTNGHTYSIFFNIQKVDYVVTSVNNVGSYGISRSKVENENNQFIIPRF